MKPKYGSRLDFLLNASEDEYDAQWSKEELARVPDLYDVVTSGWFDWEAYEEMCELVEESEEE